MVTSVVVVVTGNELLYERVFYRNNNFCWFVRATYNCT
jgi:hypothetical protein